jgi:hypothetical protein
MQGVSTDDEVADDVLATVSTPALVVDLPSLPRGMQAFKPEWVYNCARLIEEQAQINV